MKSIERMPVVQQVVSSIKEYIASENRRVGEKLPTEHELCEQLNVGRSTLREAFRILQANGYVEIKPGKGAFIASKEGYSMNNAIQWISENKLTLRDITEVRMAIEELSVGLAIQRATAGDIDDLVRIHEEFLEAATQNDSERTPELDAQFHNYIAEMTKNKLLISINKTVSTYLQAFRSQTFKIPRNTRNSIGPHSAIVDAFIKKDVDRGVQEMHIHFKKVFEDLENEP